MANLKAPLRMLRVWTGFLWPIGTFIHIHFISSITKQLQWLLMGIETLYDVQVKLNRIFKLYDVKQV